MTCEAAQEEVCERPFTHVEGAGGWLALTASWKSRMKAVSLASTDSRGSPPPTDSDTRAHSSANRRVYAICAHHLGLIQGRA